MKQIYIQMRIPSATVLLLVCTANLKISSNINCQREHAVASRKVAWLHASKSNPSTTCLQTRLADACDERNRQAGSSVGRRTHKRPISAALTNSYVLDYSCKKVMPSFQGLS